MVIESTRKGNSFFDEMKSKIFELHSIECQTAYQTYTSEDELAKALEISTDNYNFNLSKLDHAYSLLALPEEIQTKLFAQKTYIESQELAAKNKIEFVLTTVCLFSRYKLGICDYSPEELYSLARAMVNVPLDCYYLYEVLVLIEHKQFDTLLKLMEDRNAVMSGFSKTYKS